MLAKHRELHILKVDGTHSTMAYPARPQQVTPPARWWAVLVTTPGLLSLIWTARAARRKPEVAPAGEVVTEASLDIASAAVAP